MHKSFLIAVLALSLFACNKTDPRDDAYDNPGSTTPVSSTVYFEAELNGVAWSATTVLVAQNVISSGGLTTGSLLFSGENGDESMGVTMTNRGRINEGTYEIVRQDSSDHFMNFLYGSNDFAYSMPLSTPDQKNFIKIDKISGTNFEGTFGGILIEGLSGNDTIVITNGRFKSDNYGEF